MSAATANGITGEEFQTGAIVRMSENRAVLEIPLDNLKPNPFQPPSRLKVSDSDLEQLTQSILSVGIIVRPLVRQKPDELPMNGNSIYEVADGWRRICAYRWLSQHGHPEYARVPCEVAAMDDQRMADVIPEANDIHKSMSDIDRAHYYRQYIDRFGITQGELAKRQRCTQGEIGNTIRLLELPEDLQAKIISQEMKATHARYLLRLNYNPQYQRELAESCVLYGWSKEQLDGYIDTKILATSKCLNPDSLSNYDLAPKFNLSACTGCASIVKVKKEDRCVNDSCWKQKQAQAEAEIRLTTERQAALIEEDSNSTAQEVTSHEAVVEMAEKTAKQIQKSCSSCNCMSGNNIGAPCIHTKDYNAGGVILCGLTDDGICTNCIKGIEQFEIPCKNCPGFETECEGNYYIFYLINGKPGYTCNYSLGSGSETAHDEQLKPQPDQFEQMVSQVFDNFDLTRPGAFRLIVECLIRGSWTEWKTGILESPSVLSLLNDQHGDHIEIRQVTNAIASIPESRLIKALPFLAFDMLRLNHKLDSSLIAMMLNKFKQSKRVTDPDMDPYAREVLFSKQDGHDTQGAQEDKVSFDITIDSGDKVKVDYTPGFMHHLEFHSKLVSPTGYRSDFPTLDPKKDYSLDDIKTKAKEIAEAAAAKLHEQDLIIPSKEQEHMENMLQEKKCAKCTGYRSDPEHRCRVHRWDCPKGADIDFSTLKIDVNHEPHVMTCSGKRNEGDTISECAVGLCRDLGIKFGSPAECVEKLKEFPESRERNLLMDLIIPVKVR